jgi:ectoine hydroxylase-related dioxygenase (phytanoyl-CoA dioxygenase family)
MLGTAVGEFLVFGSHLAHRSGPNHSEFGRAAIYATYVPSDVFYSEFTD